MFSIMLPGELGAQDAIKRATNIEFKKHRAVLFPLCLRVSVKVVFGGLSKLSLILGLFIFFA